jgi:hypothetical protein
MTAASPEDYAPLDEAFTLPPEPGEDTPGVHIPQQLRELFEFLVVRMRREAHHLPMNTVQQLLIERIAFNYIMLKAKERRPLGDDQGFQHAGIQKDWNTFWLSMTGQFNDLLLKNRASDEELRRQEELKARVGKEVLSVLNAELADRALFEQVRHALAEAMDRVGL